MVSVGEKWIAHPRRRQYDRLVFEALNRVQLRDAEFARLLEQIITPDVFAAAPHLRELPASLLNP